MIDILVIFGLVVLLAFLLSLVFKPAKNVEPLAKPKVEPSFIKVVQPTPATPRIKMTTRTQELNEMADELSDLLECKYCTKLRVQDRMLSNSEMYILKNIVRTSKDLDADCRYCGKHIHFYIS